MLTARASGFRSVALTIGALALLGAQADALPDAAAIMKRAADAVAAAKTYQATVVNSVSAGQMGSMTLSTEVKAIPAAGKTAVRQSVVGKPTGMMAMQAAMANMVAVDDGKNAYVYMPAMGGYRKGPHQPSKGGMQLGLQGLSKIKGLTYKLIGTENVEGRPAYAIQLIPPKQQPGVMQKVVAYVDQATGRLRELRSSASGKPAGGKGAAIQRTMVVSIKNEILNAPIPDSAFRFTPPAGAKELPATPPTAMAPHGALSPPAGGKK